MVPHLRARRVTAYCERPSGLLVSCVTSVQMGVSPKPLMYERSVLALSTDSFADTMGALRSFRGVSR